MSKTSELSKLIALAGWKLLALAGWKLLAGSHEFPGSNGGTCINEAALVVAGFPYRKINSVKDMPVCFSRPISAFAIKLNDRLSDADRQKLLPFVIRLAGTADTPTVERERVDALIRSLVNEVLPRMLRRRGIAEKTVALCEAASSREEVRAAAFAAKEKTRAAAYAAAYAAAADAAAYAAYAYAYAAYDAADAAHAATYDAAYAATYAAAYAADAATYAAAYAADAADAAAYAAADAADQEFFASWGLRALDLMLSIGNKAEPIEAACVVDRMERAKVRKEA